MHIAVDGSFWGGEERGVAVATRRLWSALLPRLTGEQVTVFAPFAPDYSPDISWHKIGPLHGFSRALWQQMVLPREVRAKGIDLLYCPCYTIPINTRCRTVVTIHDLIAWTHPHLAGWANATHLRTVARYAISNANAVCVPNQLTREAVLARFGLSPSKVFVVPWGVDHDIEPVPEATGARRVAEVFKVSEPYVLFCGCLEPKKNLGTAIRATQEANILLLIVGPKDHASDSLLSGAGTGFRYLGYVSTEDLSALYSAARALILPSHVEGFGLPAIEAMRCGCPVVASDAPVIRDVCGGAAVHVAENDVALFATAVHNVVADSTLREDLIARSRARAAEFSWANAVERFIEALHYAGWRSS